MQKKTSSRSVLRDEENRKALDRAWKAKKPDPYERVLERIGYYVVTKRIRLGTGQLKQWPPRVPKWDRHDDLTIQLYGVNEWNVLNWFIQLVKKGPLTALSPAEILALREESLVLQGRAIPDITAHGAGVNDPLSLTELSHLQSTVRSHVDEFLQSQTFTFKEFRPTLLIERDPDDARRLIAYEFVPPFHGQGLLYLFATLLRRVRLPIERCPRCQHIFLKARKDAGYCSRECQSVHYAQKQRGDRPPGKRGRPKKLQPGMTATQQKGAQNGQKRR